MAPIERWPQASAAMPHAAGPTRPTLLANGGALDEHVQACAFAATCTDSECRTRAGPARCCNIKRALNPAAQHAVRESERSDCAIGKKACASCRAVARACNGASWTGACISSQQASACVGRGAVTASPRLCSAAEAVWRRDVPQSSAPSSLTSSSQFQFARGLPELLASHRPRNCDWSLSVRKAATLASHTTEAATEL